MRRKLHKYEKHIKRVEFKSKRKKNHKDMINFKYWVQVT